MAWREKKLGDQKENGKERWMNNSDEWRSARRRGNNDVRR
jgi:hypothetical protein